MIHVSGFFQDPDIIAGNDLDLERMASSNPDGDFTLWLGTSGDRKVVYKAVSQKNAGNPLFVNLLRREYDIGRSLNHPGICETLAWQNRPDIGPCIMMEFIDGYTLEEAIMNKTLNKDALKKVLSDICDAVIYLHQKQVIHRDLKPSNIMITRMGGNVKILDFGLADTDSNLSGKVPAGTRMYAAPEVLSGEQADFRSDIYSIGRIIKECNIGFKRIAGKCSRENKFKRYSSVGELKEALQKRVKASTIIIAGIVMAAIAVAGIILYNSEKKDAASDLFMELIDMTRKTAKPS